VRRKEARHCLVHTIHKLLDTHDADAVYEAVLAVGGVPFPAIPPTLVGLTINFVSRKVYINDGAYTYIFFFEQVQAQKRQCGPGE